jgi:Lon protease-like protein
MVEKLSLFPLNTVLFPGMPINLHIFESRYKLMIQRALLTDNIFGVTLIRQGTEALGSLAEPFYIGTTAKIVDVERLDNGHMNITAIGEERFLIKELDRESAVYLTGFVEKYPLELHRPLDIYRRLRQLRSHVQYYLRTLDSLEEVQINLESLDLPEDPMVFLFLASSLLQIPATEKQPILSAPTALDFCTMVERLYRRENAVLRDLKHISAETAQNLAILN